MTISICKISPNGLHKFEWHMTGDGGGYWVCTLPGCEAVEHDGTGHHGGHVVIDTLFAIVLGILLVCAIAVGAYRDRHLYDHCTEVFTKEAPNAHE